MNKEQIAEMGIGIIDNNVIHMKFGKGKIGVTVGGNSESENPVVLLVPIKKKSIGEPFTPDDMKKDRMSVALEFDSIDSIDVVIKGLEEAKRRILIDEINKKEIELVMTKAKLRKISNTEE